MSEEVKIIECPRNAWQSLPKLIPAEVKATYLRDLITAGFQHIDAVSFLPPQAAPPLSPRTRLLSRASSLSAEFGSVVQ